MRGNFFKKGETMKVATLGPKGTFSHQAAVDINHNPEIIFEKTIRDVFEVVSNKKADKGVVPVENSVGGTVGLTLDALLDSDLLIEAEEVVPIVHNLLIRDENIKEGDIRKIYAHEQTYAQCEKYIRDNFSETEIIETISNGESARLIHESQEKKVAAIGPKIASKVYNLCILKSNIQDHRFNVTRFFIISKQKTKSTGYDRTSICIYPQIDRPGLLRDFLDIFAKNKVNLTKIESRPSKGKLGDYVFYLDCEGHLSEENVKKSLSELEKTSFVKFLGSYPRKY